VVDETSEARVGEEDKGALNRIWQSLNPPIRFAVLAVGAAALVFIMLITLSRAAPVHMEVLFHRLDPAQAREVAGALDEMGVRYELADDGSTIMVPRDQRDRLRLTLSPDLYNQGIGFALFENGGLVSSDFERRVQWQIALEEELRRTITSIDAVDQARVHLVITEEGVFIRDRKEPSASIFLRLNPLASLSETQVRGILSLVAGSVEGLKPENVTIVDARGNILFDAFAAIDEMSASTVVEAQLKLKRQFETELEKRLCAVLEQVYGPGKAVAMVSADLDFDTREQTNVTYDNDPASRSTHRVEERSDNMGAPLEEVGEPNIPGQAAVLGGGGESSYERIEEIVNYEVSETREYIASAPGQVVRLSTAVIIDNPGNDPFLEAQVANLVNSAVGLNEIRGDTVSIQLLPFDNSWVGDPERDPFLVPEGEAFPMLYAFLGPNILLVILVALYFMIKARKRRRNQEHDFDALALEDELASRIDKDSRSAEPSEAETKAQTIRKLAKDEPESVAGLLKTWLAEE
jgi:flagellar M-ring protein FliF